MTVEYEPVKRPGRAPQTVQLAVPRALLGYWRVLGSVAGTLMVIAGFAGIIVSWVGSTTEIDIRMQMQELISCVGFLGLITVGMFLLAGEVFAGMRQGLAPQLDAIASALEELARSGQPLPVIGGSGADEVLASDASYHLASCELVAGKSTVGRMSEATAIASGLRPCRTCIGSNEVTPTRD